MEALGHPSRNVNLALRLKKAEQDSRFSLTLHPFERNRDIAHSQRLCARSLDGNLEFADELADDFWLHNLYCMTREV